MKIQEQRIGNLVYGIYETETGETDQIICRVVAVDETESLGDGWSSIIQRMDDGPEIEEYEDTAPIPLTEEFLIRFGFSARLDNLFYVNFFFTLAKSEEGFRLWIVSGTYGRTIHYVHELQNLYYALTGQELTSAPPQR